MQNLQDKMVENSQPKALPILFLAEMWERFGFYIVQGLLVLYLTQALGWSDDKSYAVTGLFTAFVYISPIVGGYIADRILGFKVSIVTGGILLTVGYGLVAACVNQDEFFLDMALSIIVVGNGFFKPNVGSLLGTFYEKDDPRREAGFTWFYMGINVGSMLSTLVAGFIKDAFGWSAGFGMASIGLLFGTGSFLIRLNYLKGHGVMPAKKPILSALDWLHTKTAIVVGVIVAVPLLTFLLQEGGIATALLSVVAFFLVIGLIVFAWKQDTLQARKKMLALIFLTVISVIFWAIFFQIYFSLNLFIDRSVDRTFWGYQIPTVAFISFEGAFIVLLSPFIARFWTYLASIRKNPSIPVKFFLSFLGMGIAFLILTASTHFHDAAGFISPFWIPLAYLVITISELLLSPIGLAAVTMLSSPRMVGMMMGVFLMGIGYGGKLAGVIAKFSSIPEDVTNKFIESQYYGDAFFTYALISFAAAFIVLLFVPYLKRLIGYTPRV